MIKITIDGSAHTGKTLIAMRIAQLLQDEGVDVTVLTEDSSKELLIDMFSNRIDEISPKHFEAMIFDTNNSKYDPLVHQTLAFKGKK